LTFNVLVDVNAKSLIYFLLCSRAREILPHNGRPHDRFNNNAQSASHRILFKGMISKSLATKLSKSSAIAAYRDDRCEAALWEELRVFGWPNHEIEAVIAKPHATLVCGYGIPDDHTA